MADEAHCAAIKAGVWLEQTLQQPSRPSRLWIFEDDVAISKLSDCMPINDQPKQATALSLHWAGYEPSGL